MRSRACLAVCFLVAAALAQAPNSSSSKEEELRHAEHNLVEALVNSDVARLEKLLGDDLTYTHSTGVKESKAEFLHRIQSGTQRSEEHTSELQSRVDLVCRLLLEKKKKINIKMQYCKSY